MGIIHDKYLERKKALEGKVSVIQAALQDTDCLPEDFDNPKTQIEINRVHNFFDILDNLFISGAWIAEKGLELKEDAQSVFDAEANK